MSNNDTASYDEFNLISGQDWFFDELQNNSHAYDFNSSLNGPLDNGPSGSPVSAQTAVQQSSQIQQNSNNVYQNNVGLVDEPMPSTSDYGMQQPHTVPQQRNQPVQQSQHQPIPVSSQQQYETLRPYNAVPQLSNQYHERPQMDMIYEQSLDLEFMMNEATTSNAMPLECGISQEYNQTDQRQYQQQQRQNNNEPQWIPLENNQSHQQNSQMTVVYTSTSQNVPKIPDPGGHQSQILNYNTSQQPPQIIQTGSNGETVLTNMQPVQQMHHPVIQSQQYDMNSGNYVHYIDQPGRSQPYLPQEQMNNSYLPVQVVNHPVGIPQIIPTQSPAEPVRQTPKPRAKPQKTPAKRKSQPPPTSSEGLESIMAEMQTNSLEVKFTPEAACKMSELMNKIAYYQSQSGYEQEMKMLLNEVKETILQAEIAANRQTASKQPTSKTRVQSQQFTTQSTPVMAPQNATGRKKRTKAELQNQKAAMIAAHPAVPMQTPISINDSCIVAQDSSSITIKIEGKMMRGVMVSNSNGTATYQIQGPVDQPIPLQPATQSKQKPRSIIEQVTAGPEENKRMMNIVSDIIDNCESKPSRKAPQRKPKKANELKAEAENVPNTKVFQPTTKQLEPYCVPSTSNFLSKHKINLPTIAILARNVKEKKEGRRRKIADFLNRMKENLATTDINSPFADKQDAFQRILPYGLHYEPFISDLGVETFDNELIRHRVHNELMKDSLDKRMKNLFLKETMQQNFDAELDMMLTLDVDYERRLFEKEKAAAEKDKEGFVNNSDILKSRIRIEELEEAKQNLILKKPKHPQTKHYRRFTFEIRDFEEEIYRRRKQNILDQIEKEKQAKLDALNTPSSDESSSSSVSPPPVKHFPEKIKIPEFVEVKPPPVKSKLLKLLSSSSSSSDDSSSDESFVRQKTHKQEKKFELKHRSPSPQKRKSSPTRKLAVKKLELPVNIKLEKPQVPASKPKLPPQLPPEYSPFPPIKFTNYRIPKITETPSTVAVATGQSGRQMEKSFNSDVNKIKTNAVEPVKIGKSDITQIPEKPKIISHDVANLESFRIRLSDSQISEKSKIVAQDVTNVEPIKIRKSDSLHIPRISKIVNPNSDVKSKQKEEFVQLPKLTSQNILEPATTKSDSIQKFKIKLPLKENTVEKLAEKEKERHKNKEKKKRQKEERQKELRQNEEQTKNTLVGSVNREVAPSLKLKINVGSIKNEVKEVEADQELERKMKKKHKKEKEREKERKREKDENRKEKKLRKLEKERRRAEKEERKREKMKQNQVVNPPLNAIVNNHINSSATADPPRLVFRFKKIDPPNTTPTQEGPSTQITSKSTDNAAHIKSETHEKKSHKEHKKEKRHKREHSSATVSETAVPLKVPKLKIKFGSTAGTTTLTAKTDAPRESPESIHRLNNLPNAHATRTIRHATPVASISDPLLSSLPSTHSNSHSFMRNNISNDEEAGLSNVRSESPLSMDSRGNSGLDLKAITGKILIKLNSANL